MAVARAAMTPPPENQLTQNQVSVAAREEIIHPGSSAGLNFTQKAQVFRIILDFSSAVRHRPDAVAGDALLSRQLDYIANSVMGYENERTPPPPRGNANVWAQDWTNRFNGAYGGLLDGVIGEEYGHLRKKVKSKAKSNTKKKSASKSKSRRRRRS